MTDQNTYPDDEVPPDPPMDDMTSTHEMLMPDDLPPYISPTLASISAKERPEPSTVCEVCPASVWLRSPDGIKCYCRVLHLMIWTKEEPNVLTHCDGEVMANLERQKAASKQ